MFDRRINDRFAVIAPLVRAGEVLDLGIVNARPERGSSTVRLEHSADALFRRIAQANPNVVGVDIDAEGIEVLKEQGYDVHCADVETMDLGRQFDTIVAGELIEHLENPGLCLRNIRRHLKPEGQLVLTTPNPFYKAQSWKIWRYGRPSVHEDHMNWQDPATLMQLLMRTGFEQTAGYWIQHRRKLHKCWPQFLRSYFSHSFLVVATPAKSEANAAPILKAA